MEILLQALKYVKAGLSIHLLRPLQKAPIANAWSSIPNNSLNDIKEEFRSHPDANIGVRLGEFSKIDGYFLYALDLDISSDDPEDIEKAYNALSKVYKDYDKLPCVKSSSKNSRHFYFLSNVVLKNKKLATSKNKVTKLINGESKNKNAYEIDLMATGKQLVIPPSVFNSNTYKWERDLLEYLEDDDKKVDMIVNDISLLNEEKEEKNLFDKVEINLTLTEIKEALDSLDESYLNDYDKWLSIGMALHHEYSDTDNEQEALTLYENWSKKGDKYEKNGCLKKWKSFTKKEDGITIATLLSQLPKKTISKIEAFSKFLADTEKLDFENLKIALNKYALQDYELDMFIDDIAKELTTTYKRKINSVTARKTIAGLRKDAKKEAYENEEKLTIGLDDTLAKEVLKNKFEGGKYLINQNGNVFYYKKGVWRAMELAVLSSITYDAISDIILSDKEEYNTIRKAIFKKKKNDDMNGLTNQIVATILKLVTSPIDEDILNLQHKKTFKYSVINTLNKEIYIQDGKVTVEDHKYDSYLMSQMNVHYDPAAQCPHYMNSLKKVFQDLPDCDDVIRHWGEVWGLTIQSKKDLPFFGMCLGSGENGKSTSVKAIIELMGIDSCLSVSVNKFTQGAHSEAGMMGKLALFDDDFKKNDILDDGFIKRTSETTPITANPKFKNEITFYSNMTTWISANNNPKVKDVSHGMSRRAQVFPFTHRFTEAEKDMKLKDKIALERSGILNFLIESYINLMNRGHFEVPLSCQKAINSWIKASNALHAFIDEKLIVTGDFSDSIKGQRLFDLYKNYVENENSSYSMTRNNFYDDITSINGKIRQRVHSSDKNLYIEGVKLRG